MNQQQLARYEHSERLIAVHIHLMRKPLSHSKQLQAKLQAKVMKLDAKLATNLHKLFKLINSTVQP
ncbi:hypothetical protein [Photobacterium carnosum]|uniref:hypothetical protein n=1 Tax=Photobacterium carnosum TaxID=2023717 RepID=UPI001E291FEF|nr:hypothetical protein [Photobacterium carnosum]MCD9516434.1 hypothetical protein [Photobacterium carnosum]